MCYHIRDRFLFLYICIFFLTYYAVILRAAETWHKESDKEMLVERTVDKWAKGLVGRKKAPEPGLMPSEAPCLSGLALPCLLRLLGWTVL